MAAAALVTQTEWERLQGVEEAQRVALAPFQTAWEEAQGRNAAATAALTAATGARTAALAARDALTAPAAAATAAKAAQDVLVAAQVVVRDQLSTSHAEHVAEQAVLLGLEQVEDAAVAALQQAVNTDLPALATAALAAQAGPQGDGTLFGTQFALAAQTAQLATDLAALTAQQDLCDAAQVAYGALVAARDTETVWFDVVTTDAATSAVTTNRGDASALGSRSPVTAWLGTATAARLAVPDRTALAGLETARVPLWNTWEVTRLKVAREGAADQTALAATATADGNVTLAQGQLTAALVPQA